MRYLLETAIKIKGAMLQARLDKAAENPEGAQQKLLLSILKKNAACKYGKAYNFSAIKDEDGYRNNVPVVRYGDIEPDIRKMLEGEKNIMTCGRIVMFNMTSGTGASPKYIPMTAESYKKTMDLTFHWLYGAIKAHPNLLAGKNIGIANKGVEELSKGNTVCGCFSGMVRSGAASRFGGIHAVPEEVSMLGDYKSRYYLTARFSFEQNVSFIVTPCPLTIINMVKTGMEYSGVIIESIRKGVLFPEGFFAGEKAGPALIKKLSKYIKPNPKRADELESILTKQGRLMPYSIWPQMQLIGCWTAGNVGYKADELDCYFGKSIAKRDLGYIASEAASSIPFKDNYPGTVLAVQNNYYEFIPEEQAESASYSVLSCWQLEKNKNYKILLTNGSGLYRYDIGDIIRVVDFYKKAPVIIFQRKCNDIIDISGEKNHVNHFMETFAAIKKESGIEVRQFRAVGNAAKSRYEIYLDVDEKEEIRQMLPQLIENTLKAVNPEYLDERDSGRLAPPVFYFMKPGWEAQIMGEHINKGRRDTQYKWKSMAYEPDTKDGEFVKCTVSI
ncbi:MAG: hypothetical protein CVV21_09965 [Candidatus Goldiibacteriota bacterium HGW-Goldbacteria-1]|jgi:hypothetical protein|nr:MAG: hypothetical protein CVV21_09965 [Candidatus Goldiibacteriota bacterium HGW-Goldbacteria-1]